MSSLPDQAPRLPKWPFFLGDGLLLLTAWYIARTQGHAPLNGPPLTMVVLCVVIACILCTIPLIADYAWTQDKALDERQRSLEALSRTTSTASEQISIAAQGLQELVESAHKNLKAADQLPGKLQEKLAELQGQSAAKQSDEIDELEREVAQLRASETDKLEATAATLAKAAADFGKAEAALQKQLSQAASQAEAAGRAQLQALSAAQAAAVAAIESAVKKAVKSFASAKSAPPAASVPNVPEAVETIVVPVTALPPPAPEAVPEPVASAPAPIPDPEPPPVPAAVTPTPALAPEVVVEPPPLSEVALEPEPQAQATAPEPERAPTAEPAVAPEPEPAPASEPEPLAVATEPVSETPAAASAPKAPRKRAPKKVDSDGPAQDEFIQAAPEDAPAPAETADMAISSDGATRLLVTAYIGIGNRLFIRGSGPGLTWEKGIPLQFVSIGKWRWETAEATEPVTFRLYKNDELECTGLGERSIDPGHQTQLAASF